MKQEALIWNTSSLDPFRKKVQPGALLFDQGFPAQSFFILTEGMVELIAKKNDVYTPVHYLGAGNMLGEQLLVEDKIGPRVFGARSLSPLTYLEFKKEEIKLLHRNDPTLFSQIVEAALKITTQRINRLNRLLVNMRSLNPTERFLNLLLYFSSYHGRVTSEGKAVVLHFDTVNFYIQINSVQFESLIEDLISHRVLSRLKDSVYLIRDEKVLRDQVPQISQEVGTLNFI